MSRARRFFSLLSLLCALSDSVEAESSCERIVSLAPSVTEVIYEMGLGPQLVGRTDFCRYPPEAKAVESIGGFYDVNIERLLTKKPTRVFALKENSRSVEALKRFGVPVTEVDHSSRAGIRESLVKVAAACGVEERATKRLQELDREEREILDACKEAHGQRGDSPARVMVVVGRTREGSVNSGVYVSGQDGFYAELLRMLGAENVNPRSTVAVPSLSAEGIMSLRPDTVLEIVNVDDNESSENLLSFWRAFPKLSAVKNNRVFLIDDDYASIPGPRYINVLRLFASTLCKPGS